MRLVIAILFMLGTWYLAKRKGFNPWFWFLAGGPLGLVVLLCVPSASRTPDDDARAGRKQSGDLLGLMLTAFGLAFALSLLIPMLQSGSGAGAWPFIALVYSPLMLVTAVLLARDMAGPWKNALILLVVVAAAWSIPGAILAIADVQWLKSEYRPGSGLQWYAMSEDAYFGIDRLLQTLYSGALLLVAVAASRTAHGNLQLRLDATGRFDKQLLGFLLVPSLLVLSLGGLSYLFNKWAASMSVIEVLTVDIPLLWAIWLAITAVLLLRRIGMPWWMVAVMAVPQLTLDLARSCAVTFQVWWLTLGELVSDPIEQAVFSGVGFATSVGLLYVATQLHQALRPVVPADSSAVANK